MTIGPAICVSVGEVELQSMPINPDWILEGAPVARCGVLSNSPDGSAATVMWDCTAGRFNWHYGIDETVCIIEGSMIIKEPSGQVYRVGVGEAVYFPAGTRAEWTVDKYVRKIAYCRAPAPRALQFAGTLYYGLRRLLGKGQRKTIIESLFG